MPLAQLASLAGPWLHLDLSDRSLFCDHQGQAVRKLPQIASRLVRGRKCCTESGLFDEVAAALQFPWYFGENWDALDECLNDLEWLAGDGYIVWIDEATKLLNSEPHEIWLRLLAGAANDWRHPDQALVSACPPKPFHVVLQVTPEDEIGAIARLAAAGVSFDRLALDS